MTKYLLLAITAVALTACVSGKAPADTYTSPTTGKTTVIQSDKEMCEQSCNDDYSRCMDASPADQGSPGVPNATPGAHPGMFGPASECRSELSSCLPGCKSR